MYAYLRLSAQPMQVRFDFHRARAHKRVASGQAEKEGVVYAVLIIDRIKYGPYATLIKPLHSVWVQRRSIRQSADVKRLTVQLSDYQLLLEEAYAELVLSARKKSEPLRITGADVMAALAPRPVVSLPVVYTEFMAYKALLIENDRAKRGPDQISQATYDTYPKRWVLLNSYLLASTQTAQHVDQVRYASAEKLKAYLLTQRQADGRPYAMATINKVISLLKMLLTFALSREYVSGNALASYSCRGGSAANPKPLTEAQLLRLETCELPPVLRHQCDSWLVAGELCLHYSDYCRLPHMRILRTESGRELLQQDRSKQAGTTLLQTVNVTPRATRLLAKYGGVTGLYYGSSAYFSKLLKRIAKLADLRDETGALIDLQFGQGRDSGLTARARQGANGIQLSRMAGWSKPSYANRYLGDAAGIVDAFASRAESQAGEGPTTPPESEAAP